MENFNAINLIGGVEDFNQDMNCILRDKKNHSKRW